MVKHPARPLHVKAGRLRLAQVPGNLLMNAAKYMPPGGRFELTATADDAEIVLSVTDNGIGLPPDKLSAVFLMFSQVNPDHHRHGGRGIGLALSKSLVELPGGRLTASSAGENCGRRFSMHPRAQRGVAPAPVPTRDVSTSGSSGPKRRVLVVDDDVDAADALTALLELEGHEMRTVYSEEEAIGILVQYLPAVILLDVGLPGISGLTLHGAYERHRERRT